MKDSLQQYLNHCDRAYSPEHAMLGDQFSRSYGIWSWYMGELIENMRPPDWNWVDFLGARLAQVLAHHSAQLSAALVSSVRQALGHAAWCIFRHNVHLEYTNIAIMGGPAGELLNEPRLLDYGRERLRRVVELIRSHGSSTECHTVGRRRVTCTRDRCPAAAVPGGPCAVGSSACPMCRSRFARRSRRYLVSAPCCVGLLAHRRRPRLQDCSALAAAVNTGANAAPISVINTQRIRLHDSSRFPSSLSFAAEARTPEPGRDRPAR